jgi:hypothetical protein
VVEVKDGEERRKDRGEMGCKRRSGDRQRGREAEAERDRERNSE